MALESNRQPNYQSGAIMSAPPSGNGGKLTPQFANSWKTNVPRQFVDVAQFAQDNFKMLPHPAEKDYRANATDNLHHPAPPTQHQFPKALLSNFFGMKQKTPEEVQHLFTQLPPSKYYDVVHNPDHHSNPFRGAIM